MNESHSTKVEGATQAQHCVVGEKVNLIGEPGLSHIFLVEALFICPHCGSQGQVYTPLVSDYSPALHKTHETICYQCGQAVTWSIQVEPVESGALEAAIEHGIQAGASSLARLILDAIPALSASVTIYKTSTEDLVRRSLKGILDEPTKVVEAQPALEHLMRDVRGALLKSVEASLMTLCRTQELTIHGQLYISSSRVLEIIHRYQEENKDG